LLTFFIAFFTAGFFIGSTVSVEVDNKSTGQVANDTKDMVYMLFTDRVHQQNFTGTGFAIKIANHKYLVTAAHICSSEVKAIAYNSKLDKTENIVTRDRFKLYRDHDLCVVSELDTELSAFEMASSVSDVENYYAVGHPNHYPLVATKGNLLGLVSLTLEATYLSIDNCLSSRHSITTKRINNEQQFVCVFSGPIYATSIPVTYGSSGSPIINKNYEVVGVVSIVDGSSPGNWAGMVPLKDLELFLNSL